MREYPQSKLMDLTIPSHIWNDKTLTDTQRVHLALLYKLSDQGANMVDYLTQRQSQILGKGTTEKMVINNLRLFKKRGYIDIVNNVLSRNEKDQKGIHYIYRVQATQDTSNDTSNLF